MAGYGGTTDQLVGLTILASALVMFAFRGVVQDRAPLRWPETTPRLPGEPSAGQPDASGVGLLAD